MPTCVGITTSAKPSCCGTEGRWPHLDRRSSGRTDAQPDSVSSFGKTADQDEIRRTTGLRLDPYFSATKLSWIRTNDAGTWKDVASGRTVIGTIDSYLIARMSGGRFHVTDASNASRTLLYDIHAGRWSEKLCSLFDIPIDVLPDLVSSYGDLAHTDPNDFLGLDLPITGIAGDQQAALVGQAAFSSGEAKCTYGTGSSSWSTRARTPSAHTQVYSPLLPSAARTDPWRTRSRARCS